MVVAESLCCGTPVVGFKAGGPETIAIPEFCEFVEYGDVEAIVAETEKMLAGSFDKNNISAVASDKYSKKNMFVNYNRLYQNYHEEGKENDK